MNYVPQVVKYMLLFLLFFISRTQKVNDPCGQHIYIQEQCSTFDIDVDIIVCVSINVSVCIIICGVF